MREISTPTEGPLERQGRLCPLATLADTTSTEQGESGGEQYEAHPQDGTQEEQVQFWQENQMNSLEQRRGVYLGTTGVYVRRNEEEERSRTGTCTRVSSSRETTQKVTHEGHRRNEEK